MHTLLSCLLIWRGLPGVTLVILSGLPLIMHMVRAASLSAGSRDSVRERREREEEEGGKEGGEGERREGREEEEKGERRKGQEGQE